jgi:hypothetical protein
MVSGYRQRNAASLRRSKAKHEPRQSILIVCEGQKTEPYYFSELRRKHNLSATRIEITHNPSGTHPRSIVDEAERLFLNNKIFDHVYAVFDRDQHETYFDALTRIGQLNCKYRNHEKKKVPFTAIASIPCFEIWVLLHFKDVFEFKHRDEIFNELKTAWPQYEKAHNGVYSYTFAKKDDATKRAQKLCSLSNYWDDTKPYTNVIDLENHILKFVK